VRDRAALSTLAPGGLLIVNCDDAALMDAVRRADLAAGDEDRAYGTNEGAEVRLASFDCPPARRCREDSTLQSVSISVAESSTLITCRIAAPGHGGAP